MMKELKDIPRILTCTAECVQTVYKDVSRPTVAVSVAPLSDQFLNSVLKDTAFEDIGLEFCMEYGPGLFNVVKHETASQRRTDAQLWIPGTLADRACNNNKDNRESWYIEPVSLRFVNRRTGAVIADCTPAIGYIAEGGLRHWIDVLSNRAVLFSVRHYCSINTDMLVEGLYCEGAISKAKYSLYNRSCSLEWRLIIPLYRRWK